MKNNLFTGDITKPFLIKDGELVQKFDVISAWEVIEHIATVDLEQMFINIKSHMHKDSIFMGSISTVPDIEIQDGRNLHQTVMPKEWWFEFIDSVGFEVLEDVFEREDYVHGGEHNGFVYYKPLSTRDSSETSFMITLKTKEG